ncbi:hypothetical protein JTB14_025066 [Gonioctena quinquepunctata]|nr:hypothetical protein JTB14_025066 [Gonioctena quinquepunctata]
MSLETTRSNSPIHPYFLGNPEDSPYHVEFWTSGTAGRHEEQIARRRESQKEQNYPRLPAGRTAALLALRPTRTLGQCVECTCELPKLQKEEDLTSPETRRSSIPPLPLPKTWITRSMPRMRLSAPFQPPPPLKESQGCFSGSKWFFNSFTTSAKVVSSGLLGATTLFIILYSSRPPNVISTDNLTCSLILFTLNRCLFFRLNSSMVSMKAVTLIQWHQYNLWAKQKDKNDGLLLNKGH